MTDNVIPIDSAMPEHPDGPLVATIIARLIQEPDPQVRWRAIDALDKTQLNWVRRLTVAQLQAEGRSLSQIGDRLGITKGRAGQLANPKANSDDPAYAWGRLLAATELLAEWANALPEHGSVMTTALASATTALRARLNDDARRWGRRAPARHSEEVPDALTRVAELLTDSEGLLAPLTIDQREQIVLGYHHERGERGDRD